MCEFKDSCLCWDASGSAFALPEGTCSISYAFWDVVMEKLEKTCNWNKKSRMELHENYVKIF